MIKAIYTSMEFNTKSGGEGGDCREERFWNIVGEAVITDLDVADDVVIFAEIFEVLVHVLDTLSTESEPLEL